MDDQVKGLPHKWLPDATSASAVLPEPPADSAGNGPTPHQAWAPAKTVDSEENQKALGQELAAIFKDASVHPVLIFGSKGSGKTSLLASLFRYQQLDTAEATLALNEDLLPADKPEWQAHSALARRLYYGKVLDFIKRKAPPATLDETPFFIPVTLTRTTGEEARFAFLEGRGEWYMPNEQADVPYRPFQGLLQGLLAHYNHAATVIYVAPYTTGSVTRDGGVDSANNANLHHSDVGLLGAIGEYMSLRRATYHRDYQLFLMTKWDIHCGGIADAAFQHPPTRPFQDVLKERFPLSWARFQNLNFPGSAQNKMYSSYCSGVIDNVTVLSPAQADSPIVDFYPRKLWDLLYENNTGKPLYPDVRPRPPGLLDRFINLLRG